MKNRIIQFLYFLIKKLSKEQQHSLTFGLQMKADITKEVPADGQWHYIGISAFAWVLAKKDNEMKIANMSIYREGKDVMHITPKVTVTYTKK